MPPAPISPFARMLADAMAQKAPNDPMAVQPPEHQMPTVGEWSSPDLADPAYGFDFFNQAGPTFDAGLMRLLGGNPQMLLNLLKVFAMQDPATGQAVPPQGEGSDERTPPTDAEMDEIRQRNADIASGKVPRPPVIDLDSLPHPIPNDWYERWKRGEYRNAPLLPEIPNGGK